MSWNLWKLWAKSVHDSESGFLCWVMIGRTTPIVFAAAKRSSEGLADHLLFSRLGLDRWHLWHLASKLLNYAEMKRNRRPKGPGVFHMGHDWEPNFEDDPGPWTLGSDGSGVHSKLRWTISQVSQVEALRRRGAERIRKDLSCSGMMDSNLKTRIFQCIKNMNDPGMMIPNVDQFFCLDFSGSLEAQSSPVVMWWTWQSQFPKGRLQPWLKGQFTRNPLCIRSFTGKQENTVEKLLPSGNLLHSHGKLLIYRWFTIFTYINIY